jgi:hypothetical protein
MKNMRKHIFHVVAVIVVVSTMIGCATLFTAPQEKQVLMSYQSMGQILETAKPVMMELCEARVMNEHECHQARIAYNEAVKIYKRLKTTAMQAVDSGDQSIYTTAAFALMDLLTEIQFYTGEL